MIKSQRKNSTKNTKKINYGASNTAQSLEEIHKGVRANYSYLKDGIIVQNLFHGTCKPFRKFDATKKGSATADDLMSLLGFSFSPSVEKVFEHFVGQNTWEKEQEQYAVDECSEKFTEEQREENEDEWFDCISKVKEENEIDCRAITVSLTGKKIHTTSETDLWKYGFRLLEKSGELNKLEKQTISDYDIINMKDIMLQPNGYYDLKKNNWELLSKEKATAYYGKTWYELRIAIANAIWKDLLSQGYNIIKYINEHEVDTNEPFDYIPYSTKQIKPLERIYNGEFIDFEILDYKKGGGVNSDLIEVQPNKYLYHTSNPRFRNAISKKGLLPMGLSGSWLSDTKIKGKVIFAVNSDNKEEWWNNDYNDDIYKIDTSNLENKWFNDPNFLNDSIHIITFEKIPRNAIKMIYKGNPDTEYAGENFFSFMYKNKKDKNRYNDGGKVNTEYQFRDIDGSVAYYKRENGGKWHFISRKEFLQDARRDTIVLEKTKEWQDEYRQTESDMFKLHLNGVGVNDIEYLKLIKRRAELEYPHNKRKNFRKDSEELEEGGIVEGQLHSECNDDTGCGEKFDVGNSGHIIEVERDEAVIVSSAFNNSNQYEIEGTPSQIASAINTIGGGKDFDSGAKVNGEVIKGTKNTSDTDVDEIDGNSIIINRRSMYDKSKYKAKGTTKEISSLINNIDDNGVKITEGGVIEKI